MPPAAGLAVRSPTPVAGLEREDVILGFRPDGRSLLAMHAWEMPGRVENADLETGQRTRFREIAPNNMIGAIASGGVDFSDDGKSYAYCLVRSVGTLFSVEGAQ